MTLLPAAVVLAVTMYLTWRKPLWRDSPGTRSAASLAWLVSTAALAIGLHDDPSTRTHVVAVFVVLNVLVWVASLGRPALLMDQLLPGDLPVGLRRRSRFAQTVFLLGVIVLAFATTGP